jgi:hypothetical protein
MTDTTKKPAAELPVLCVGCGQPIAKGNYCSECVHRGLGPCEACEGLPLLDVEED